MDQEHRISLQNTTQQADQLQQSNNIHYSWLSQALLYV